MSAKRAKIIKVPGTTNNITKGIINYLKSKGHFARRINTTGIFDENKKLFRRSSNKGTSDIIACVSCRNEPGGIYFGQFLAIEVKNKGTKDTLSDDQKKFGDEVVNAHGVYYTAIGYEEFVGWFESMAW